MLNQNQGMINPSVTVAAGGMMQMQTREDCVLFIGNLSKDVNDQILYEFFAPIGNVLLSILYPYFQI
mgnify:CR=1 FL=1